ncbi:MAG: ATP-binding cassette domain-containing protein [Burkholderiaceae bacterium]|jgi:ATP-binding cassette subfamily C protein LapB
MTEATKNHGNLRSAPDLEVIRAGDEVLNSRWLKVVVTALKVQGIALPLATAKRLIRSDDASLLGELTPLFKQLGLAVETSRNVRQDQLKLVKPGSIIELPSGNLLVQGTPEALMELKNDSGQGLDPASVLGGSNDYVVHEFFKNSADSSAKNSGSAQAVTTPENWWALIAEIRQANWLIEPIKKHQPLFRELLLAALFINLLALAGPFFSMHLYDRIIPNNSMDTLWIMALGLGIAYAADSALKLARHYLMDIAGQRIDIEVTQSIAQKLFATRMSESTTQPVKFLHQYRTFEALRELLTSNAVTALVDLPFLVLYIGIAMAVHWLLALPIILNIVASMGLTWAGYLNLQKFSKNALNESADNHALWLETLQGLETLKAFSAATWSNQKLVESTLKSRQTGAHLRNVNYRLGLWAGLLQQACWMLVLIIGVYLITNSELTTGGLIAVSMLAMRCASPIGQWIGVLLQINTVHSGFSALNRFMAQPEESNSTQLPLSATTVSIQLRQMSVRFNDQTDPALYKINLDIPPGSRIALIGHMGSGKTTLIKILGSFLPVTSGQFLINERDHAQWQPSDLHDNIAYVGQHPFLFRGSLRDNLCLGRHWISDEQCYTALRTAGVESLASQASSGLNRQLTEGGTNLSGGQRQAIALARVMLTAPSVILLDEPANGLDGNAEESLKNTLARLPVTTSLILATHKMSLLSMVNRVILMHEGHILMDGKNDEVIGAMKAGAIEHRPKAAGAIK